ncbi:MAG: glutamate--tRNA ligase, partial [Pseudomonadota bacterium]
MMTVRVRFAPSPTGYLHIGGARTALFNYLYAKKNRGKFILRIEDTDLQRSTQAAVDAILESMQWLQLQYDEGPFYQTQRMPRYQEVINQLLESGHAYRCICSKERLAQLREQQINAKIKPRYDGHCREKNLTAIEQPHVIRFRNPLKGELIIQDQVYGAIHFNNAELDDLIIQRSDGTPTYNFTVVVDDWDMQITHVIRGDDHLNNTPRQVNILKALNAELPIYAHVPMILDEKGKKLSKRHGAASVMQYREQGYLPETVLNYLVRLGWSHGDQEIFSICQMIEAFDIKQIQKSPAAINVDKLNWLNQHYIQHNPASLETEILWHAKKNLVDLNQGPEVATLIQVMGTRVNTLEDLILKSKYFYADEISYDEKALAKFVFKTDKKVLQDLHDDFAALSNWQQQMIHDVIHAVAA